MTIKFPMNITSIKKMMLEKWNHEAAVIGMAVRRTKMHQEKIREQMGLNENDTIEVTQEG